VCDRGVGTDPVGEGGDTGNTINALLEGHNITSEDRVRVPLDQDEGRGGSESWEDADNDGDQLLREHCGLESGRFPSSKSTSYLTDSIRLTLSTGIVY